MQAVIYPLFFDSFDLPIKSPYTMLQIKDLAFNKE
jgi:hypothetical protein